MSPKHRASLISLSTVFVLWSAGRARAEGIGTTTVSATRSASVAAWASPAPSATSTASAAPSGVAGRVLGFELHLSGYVQADGVLWDQSSVDERDGSTGEPLNDTRFLIRRARLRADVRRGPASGTVEIDGNTVHGPVARLIAAEVALALPWTTEDEDHLPLASASIGLFKIPFGFEVQERFERRVFLDSDAASQALFPGYYDLGVKLEGAWRFLRYQLAVMNGNPVGERAFPGRDPNAAKDLLGRLGIATRVVPAVRVEAGVSALQGVGFSPGTPSTKDVIVWRDVNENGLIELSELQAISGTAGTPSERFDHRALGADLRVRAELPVLGALFVFGEVFFATNLDRGLFFADPVPLGRDLRERGFLFGFTQELFGIAQVGARYDRYDPDADAEDQQGAVRVPRDASVSTFAVFASWTPVPGARLTLEYDHRTNTLGRSPTGVPARLADDSLAVRGQVGF